MRKKYLFGIIIIVIVVAVALIFGRGRFFSGKPAADINPAKAEAACENNFKIEEATKNFANLSSGVQYAAATYLSCESTLNSDSSVCDKIPAGGLNDECKASFGADLAIMLNDAIQKKSFTDADVNNCVTKVAFNANMDTAARKQYCTQVFNAAVKNDATFCNQAKSDREKARCLLFISPDPSAEICNSIPDSQSKQGCIEMVNFVKAIRTGTDAKSCGSLYGSPMLDLFNNCEISFSHSCDMQLRQLKSVYCTS